MTASDDAAVGAGFEDGDSGDRRDVDRERIDRLLERLSPAEKIRLVHGAPDPDGLAVGYLPPIERLRIPSLSMVDGPMGIRTGPATAFPAAISLAASFDPGLARRFGRAMAAEARAYGQDVLLAPGFNLVRDPRCGRTFEYYGEDPYHASRLAVGTIEGIQDGGVVATPKHYVANNQETGRVRVSAAVAERPLRELYCRPFRAAVEEGGAGAVMAAYNRVNGEPMSAHGRLLSDVLKDEWGFDGFVMSDWWAMSSTVAAAEAGLDVEMPGVQLFGFLHGDNPLVQWRYRLRPPDWTAPVNPLRWLVARQFDAFPEGNMPNPFEAGYFAGPLRAALDRGAVEESVLEEKVRRVLETMDRFGVLDGDQPDGALDTRGHRRLAREIAVRGTVVLTNDGDPARPAADGGSTGDGGVLPIDAGTIDSIAVIGPGAVDPKIGGGGSSEVTPFGAVSPLAGIVDRAGPAVTVEHERGIGPIEETSFEGGWLPSPRSLLPSGDDPRLEDATAVAAGADLSVVLVRDDASEALDREGIGLPGDQDALVRAVAAASDRTVVVLRTSGAVATPWVDDVDAILETWYPGQADGQALAAVLFGDADPGGRLPVTFGTSLEEYPAADPERFPGVDDVARYDEGVFVGYRWFDEEGIDPAFPFGHGHSYAAFDYEELAVTTDGTTVPERATVTVRNTADRHGREVLQAYAVPDDPAVPRPPRELAGFAAVGLDAGEQRDVEIDLDPKAVQFYDAGAADWTIDPGRYTLAVGRSSRDVRLEAAIDVGGV